MFNADPKGAPGTRLAHLIAQEEGFYTPGTIPNRYHNPGDLRHSPHSFHTTEAPNAIGQIDSDADGWTDLDRQLRLYAARGLTLRIMIEDYYAPPADGNDSERYLQFVCEGLGCPDTTTVAKALEIQ